MKSLKKTLVLLVVLSMILSAVSPVFAFSDAIPEDYAEQANKMAAFGVFTGDANGNFNAEETITRAEMAVVIGRLMGLTTNEANANQNYASAFSDVAAGEWYTGWVNLVAGRGIISGFPDGTFRPNEKVTQSQAVTLIVKALGWGVVVDQTGTWPANYITKASELRLFKNAVDTNSELVTRGNVAIYCYNALTAKTWTEYESTGNTITSTSSDKDTILAKYFADFATKSGEMKLVEDAYVAYSGANTALYGANQIKLSPVEGTSEDDIADFIDADRAPKKNKENVTYEDGTSVVAYVPAEVASIANLAGRKVDVIFGEDNVVAYIAVTDDSVENVYVTAWDGKEIEIDGEEYKFSNDPKVTVTVALFGHEIEEVACENCSSKTEDEGTCTNHNGAAAVACTVCGTTSATEAKNCTESHTGNKAAKLCEECKAFADTCAEDHTSVTPEAPCATCGTTKATCGTAHTGLTKEQKCATCESNSEAAACAKDHSACKAEVKCDNCESVAKAECKNHTYGDTPEAIVTRLLGSYLNSKNELTRNVIAEFILDGDDEIESINFKLSVDGYTAVAKDGTVKVNEFVVEKISSKNVLTVAAGKPTYNDLDDYEDAEPRVIKNGEVAEVTDIEVGDVVTEVVCGSKVEVMIVTANTVEGEVADYVAKTNTLTVDGTDYKVVAAPLYNDEGDVDDFVEKSTAADVYKLFEDETATAYLNMAGEVVALVGESEATGMVLGVVTDKAELDEDSNDVEFIKVRMLAEDGSEKKYAIYNDKSGKDVKDAAEYKENKVTEAKLGLGTIVMFSADADRNIKIDDVTIIAGTETGLDFKSAADVDVKKYDSAPSVNRDDKKIDGKRFTSSTVVLNPTEEELISNWDALVKKDTDNEFVPTVEDTKVYLFTKGTKIVYVVAWVEEESYGASDTQYGIVLDVNKEKDEDDETIYVATILVDGEKETYECDADFRNDVNAGDFVAFDVADGEIDTYTVTVEYTISDYLADLAGDTMADVKDYTKLTSETSLKAITVESVEVVDGDTYIVFEDDDTVDLAEGYIVYDLVDSEEVEAISEGDWVLVTDYDTTDKVYNVVIVL